MNKENGVFLVRIKDDKYNKNKYNFINVKIIFIFILCLLLLLFIIILCINLVASFLTNKYNVNYQKIDYPKNYSPKNDYPKNNNQKFTSLETNENLLDEKSYILEQFSKFMNRKITYVDTLVLIKDWNFGNRMISLNNAIYYCEILRCKEILVSRRFSFIKNPIYYEKFNMVIKHKKNVDCSEAGTACIGNAFLYDLRYNNTIPGHRFFVIQEEFLKSVPKYKANEDDLYIHIRSGDIFYNCLHPDYAQPPLCFYEFIINNYKFKKIFIVAENKKNPVINALLDKYENIEFLHKGFVGDISYIINAHNLVLSMSSFSYVIARLSKNLKNVFSYDMIIKEEKDKFLIDDDKNEEKFIEIKMKASDEYKARMYPWRNTKEQLELMLSVTC